MNHVNPKYINFASIIDQQTLDQNIRLSTMPFVEPHVAGMPDSHLGKGCAVGAVIPTVGAIIPAAVGVDIGCVDRDSEYLSPTGWKKISEYDGGEVMQYDPETGEGEFVDPQRYVVKDADFFYKLSSKYGINQMLTPDHKVLAYQITGRDRRREVVTLTASDFVARDRSRTQGFKAEFQTTFTPKLDTSVDLLDVEVRIQVMVSADARLEGSRAVLHLSKERKIERAEKLLLDAGIEYTIRTANDGSTYIRFTPPVLTKDLGYFWSASPDQLKVIAEEALLWDGNVKDRCYYSRDKGNADFMSYAFTGAGFRSVMRADAHYLDGKTDYRVFAHKKTMIGMAGNDRTPITEVQSEDGKAYCFTVPSGFWVMRREGNIVMTGNCGMISVRTHLSLSDIDHLDRKVLREAIERAIPLSAGNNNKVIEPTAEPKLAELRELAKDSGFDPADYLKGWELQLGTLGSGNHFIEVSLDEEDRVWLFLHSGSRGVGNKIAQHHIAVSQAECARNFVTLPDRDLAFLVEGTPQFDRYIAELMWAQRFAFLNRAEMMDRVRQCFEDWTGEQIIDQETVNCHHNYTSKERHFGRDVWLSRKGAIDAHEGVMGLIPGSMGTRSYVVEGKGYRPSLCSAPHGAGREYSRSAARKTFSHEELRAAMVGIEYRDTDAFIDEIPKAYKDIDVVMNDAKELVEIKHTLRQIINVKGD